MSKRIAALCAVMALSAHLACAADGSATGGSPAPLAKEPATGMEMVFVRGGCYQMGDLYGDGPAQEPELPVHEVCVGDFYIGKYEVTQGQWKKVMGNNPSGFPDCGDNCPVENVSWNDAQDFITRLNKEGGGKYRLPTEAEWEYAARGGGKRERYSGGNDVDSVAWYGANAGGDFSHPVGTKLSNGLGIYDMSGNVWEWTNDWYGSDYYGKSPRTNPTGPESGALRTKRGGCYNGLPGNMRVSRRYGEEPGYRHRSLGFRLVRTP